MILNKPSRVILAPKKFNFWGSLFYTAITTVFLIYLALNRLMAGDEGFYALATRLTSDGQTPYIDFFFPQMPLLPYLLAAPLWITRYPMSWEYLRLMAACFTGLTCLLTYKYLKSHLKPRSLYIPTAVTTLLTTCPLFFAWQLTVENYAFTTYFLMSAILLCHQTKIISSHKLFWAGFLFAAACATRLYIGLLFPLFLWQLYKTRGNRAQLSNFKKIGTFLLGATPIALACLTLFIADPELFWFNNVRYHLDRSNMSFENALKNKTQIGLVLLGLTETVKWSGISTAVLFWGGLIGSITKWRSQPLISNSLAALLIISFLPTPAYVQYFSLATPLLALSLGTLLQDSKPRHQLLLCGCLFLVALSNLNHNIKQYTVTGKGVLGVHGPRESAQSYSLRTTQKVSHIINKHFDQNDQIFSSWTGYLVETTAHPVQGTENRFGLRIAQKLKMDKAACTRHRVTTMRAVRSRLASGQIAGIILRDHYSQQNPALVKLIATLQYKEIHRGDGVRIWKLI